MPESVVDSLEALNGLGTIVRSPGYFAQEAEAEQALSHAKVALQFVRDYFGSPSIERRS